MGSLNNWFVGACWVVAAYFAAAFCATVKFPPIGITEDGNWVMLVMFLIFFVLPFAQKLEIFQFLTFEGKLEQIKDDVNEAKEQIRHIQSLHANLSNSVTNNFYSEFFKTEKKEAQEGADSVSDEAKAKSQTFTDFGADHPPIPSLLMLRTNLEKELRILLNKTTVFVTGRKPTPYLGLMRLAEMFATQYPQYGELLPSFSFFTQIANAAAHAQSIPNEEAKEAVRIGTKLYAQLVLLNEGNTDVEHVGE